MGYSHINVLDYTSYTNLLMNVLIGLPADIVPATFKKRRATTAIKVKGEDDDEKPERAEEETARPAGLGRGQR